MAWTTPPTFADNTILSAAQLNILSEDISYLWERAQQVNVAREYESISPGDGDEANEDYVIAHKFDTFEYDVRLGVGTFDGFRIRIYDGGVLKGAVFDTADDQSAPYTYSGTTDTSSFGLTVGNIYIVRVTADGEPGSANNSAVIHKLQEIP